MIDFIKSKLEEHKKMFDSITENHLIEIEKISKKCIEAYKKGNVIYAVGNGGSAADAQHFTAELEGSTPPLPCRALTVNTSALTAIGNDYSYDDIFSRQIEANANKGDIIFAFSTSGTSPNIIKSVEAARKKGCYVVGFTCDKGQKLIDLCDISVVSPTKETPRAQEYHEWVYHTIWKLIVSGMND